MRSSFSTATPTCQMRRRPQQPSVPSTAGGREGLSRSRILRRTAHEIRRAGRIRPSLRDRPRTRPSCAEAARHRAESAPPAAGTSRRGEPAVGPARTTGRLFRRRLGPHHRAAALVEDRDVAQAMRAAASVGDDRLQRMGQGFVNPETFTHGTSAQRVQWFRRGFDSGKVSSCATFR